jgi:CRISPR-associated endonuclease Cas1
VFEHRRSPDPNAGFAAQGLTRFYHYPSTRNRLPEKVGGFLSKVIGGFDMSINTNTNSQKLDHGNGICESPKIQDGLLILHGFNAGLSIWNRQLVCRHGTADQSGEIALSKAEVSNQLRHIVIMAGNGLLTTESLRWLADAAISLTVIENNGRILLSHGKGNFPFATLARRQALAIYQNTGLQAAHWLMIEKLRGQAENLDAMSISSKRIRDEMKTIPKLASIQEIMVHEAIAAAHYWSHLENIALNFVRKDQKRIHKHWLTLGGRISPISKRAMHAAIPGQAILNYTYAVAESLCSVELSAVGLNPDVGIIHTDVDSRRSMALDLIETIRPDADRLTFQYFKNQVFRKSDFWETDRGSIRLGLDVRKAIIHNTILLEGRVRELAIQLRDKLSGYEATGIRRRIVKMGDIEIVSVCEYCGAVLPIRRGVAARRVCPDCLEIHRTANLSAGNSPGFTWKEAAITKNSRTTHAKYQERLSWEAQFSEAELPGMIQSERQRFVKEIFPKLQSVTISQISKRVGISLRYASLIKKGLNIPHPCLNHKFQDLFCNSSHLEFKQLLE